MRDFFNAYKGELYKSTRKQTLLKLVIAIVIVLILVTLVFSFMDSILGSMGISNVNLPTFNSNEEAVEIIKTTIADYEGQIARGEIKKGGITENKLYQFRALLAKYEYLLANNLSDSDYIDYGVSGSTNGIGYVTQIMRVLAEVIMFFAIIMCVKNYIAEIHSGTIKMQLLRPITRAKTFTAKYLSIYTISFCALLVFTIVAEVIGIIKFGAESKYILGVVDAKNVFVMSPFSYILVEFLGQAVKIFAVCQLTYFVSNIFNGRNSAIAIPIVILLLGSSIEGLLAYGYVGYVGFVSNFNFLTALSINGPIFRGMRLWTMLIICALWLAGMMTFNYLSFKKKDIN